ncbi:site-specific integrase [Cytobacillus praedii]|uniref:site-specific integrase n=1 Tax=Cytobacillus praedii TaxID=1742358 RepID=UPI002E1CEBBC|nr:site-specific integrase [Cytobacillus praedii]
MTYAIRHRQNSILVSSIPIQVGVNRHFNTLERGILDKNQYTDDLFETEVNYYTNFKKLTRKEVGYAFRLAFYQRIQLELDTAFSSPVNYEDYPIELLDNFSKLDELFEKHFDSFEIERANLPKYRASFKKKVVQTVFKFWLSGYGILQGYTEKTIGNCEIDYVFYRNRGSKKLGRFLATILINEPLSQVSLIPITNEKISIQESEKAKWTKFLQTNNCEIAQQLFYFTFDVLKSKAQGGFLLTYYDSEGLKRRESFPSIRWGTFREYSGSIMKFIQLLYKYGYHSIEQAISGGIIDILSSESFQNLKDNDKDNIKTVLRFWLECYSKLNGLEININRIIPISISNKKQSFGKILDFGSVYAFVSTLLDDQSDTFNENKLFDLRARRACLIQLATGKRISEVLLLKRECLKSDAEGNVYIHFHKTKNGEPHSLPASKDVIHWVQQLKKMAATEKIHISSEEYYWGDDETDYRLIPNIHNDGPMGISSINRFLRQIQEKIWSNINASRYYTSHDLRRMNAVYMKINGKSKEDIQEQLGQINIDSQLPYLETKPPEIQRHFKNIANEGIWSHLVTVNETETDENGIPLEQALKRSKKQQLSLENKENAKHFLEEIIKQVEKKKRNLPINSEKQPVSTGFPIRSHNCLATEIVNCGHTELHCFSCSRYMPDSNKLDEHKAEIFRYILLLAFNDDLAKKNKLEHDIIKLRSNDIKENLNETFKQLFQKFNLDIKQTKAIENELFSKAKTYYRKNKQVKPTLSFGEALLFLRIGVTNGK